MLRAFIMRVKASSQNVQVLGFIRLGRRPTIRKGIAKGPRKTTGKCRFCQHPLQMVECCCRFIESLLQAADRIRRSYTLTDGTKSPIQEVRYPVANEDKADNGAKCPFPVANDPDRT